MEAECVAARLERVRTGEASAPVTVRLASETVLASVSGMVVLG
jgi:hypothetical protein